LHWSWTSSPSRVMKQDYRAGTIRSAANTIRIWYGPCQCDTYSIQYTYTLLKVSKARILDFNNKVNVLGWSIQWNQQILVLKQNDHLCSVYHRFIHKVLVQHNKDQTQYALVLLYCIKVKCKRNSIGSRIVFVFLGLSPSSVSVQHDDPIDMYRLMSVSIVYRNWLYHPGPTRL